MFWEAELKALAGRKRRLTGESDLERALIQAHAQGAGHSVRWVHTLQGWLTVVRPALWLAAPLVGLALGGRVSRLTRWSAVFGSLVRGFRIASGRWRLR